MRVTPTDDWERLQTPEYRQQVDTRESEADLLVRSLRNAMATGTGRLAQVPGLLKRIIRENFWQERFDRMNGRVVHKEFSSFVRSPTPVGLGTTIEQLRFLCRDDMEALDLIDGLLQRPSGGDNNPHGCKGKPVQEESRERITVDNVHVDSLIPAENPAEEIASPEMIVDPPSPVPTPATETARPTGNSKEAALRRLRKDRPDLHAEVIAGTKTANAAMIEAGFRKRVLIVRLDDMKAAAQAIRSNLKGEQLAELIRLLQRDE